MDVRLSFCEILKFDWEGKESGGMMYIEGDALFIVVVGQMLISVAD